MFFDLWIPHFFLPDEWSFLAMKSLGKVGGYHHSLSCPSVYLSLRSGTSVFLYEWLLLVSLCCTRVSVLHHSLGRLIYILSCADLCCRVKRPHNLGPSFCLIYFAVCYTASGSLFPGDLLLGNCALFFNWIY